jgi:hypothetical protein
VKLLVLPVLAATGAILGVAVPASSRQATPFPIPPALFRSAATGRILLSGIGGNSLAPAVNPPTRITVTLTYAANVALFELLVRRHTVMPLVRIDDESEGLHFVLHDAHVTGKRVERTGPRGTLQYSFSLTFACETVTQRGAATSPSRTLIAKEGSCR